MVSDALNTFGAEKAQATRSPNSPSQFIPSTLNAMDLFCSFIKAWRTYAINLRTIFSNSLRTKRLECWGVFQGTQTPRIEWVFLRPIRFCWILPDGYVKSQQHTFADGEKKSLFPCITHTITVTLNKKIKFFKRKYSYCTNMLFVAIAREEFTSPLRYCPNMPASAAANLLST